MEGFMNSIQKQKGWLVGISIAMIVLGAVALVGGIILLVSGIPAIPAVAGILKVVFGGLLVLFGLVSMPLGIRWAWVGLALSATKGSIKQGNIAKEGGTVNMKKCDKCGTERKEGEEVCSNCGKKFE